MKRNADSEKGELELFSSPPFKAIIESSWLGNAKAPCARIGLNSSVSSSDSPELCSLKGTPCPLSSVALVSALWKVHFHRLLWPHICSGPFLGIAWLFTAGFLLSILGALTPLGGEGEQNLPPRTMPP